MMIAFVAFFIFLFIVYLLSKDDFMLLRKNVATDQVFHIIFIALIPTLFFSRLVFVLLHLSKIYVNPLVFLVIPYFPGLSFPGAIIGAWIFFIWYTRKKKLPYPRILDIFSIAYMYCLTSGFVLTGIFEFISQNKLWIREEIVGFVVLLVAILALRIFLQGKWKEGVVGSISMYFTLLFILLWYVLSFFFAKRVPEVGDLVSIGILGLFYLFIFSFSKLRPSL